MGEWFIGVALKRKFVHSWVPVMCESESGFGFESGFKPFWAGFGFGFRPWKGESGFGFKKEMVDSYSDSNPDSNFWSPITTLLKKTPLGLCVASWIRIRIRIRSSWIRIRIRIQEKRGGFGFSWIRIRGAWIRIRIRVRDAWIRTSLLGTQLVLP